MKASFDRTRTKNKTVLRTASRRNETKNKTVLRTSSEKRHGKRHRWWLSTNAHNWLRFPARQHFGNKTKNKTLACQPIALSRTRQLRQNGLMAAPQGTTNSSAAHQTIKSTSRITAGRSGALKQNAIFLPSDDQLGQSPSVNLTLIRTVHLRDEDCRANPRAAESGSPPTEYTISLPSGDQSGHRPSPDSSFVRPVTVDQEDSSLGAWGR